MRDDEPFETDQTAELSKELNQFVRQLQGFQPSLSGLDRDQLMFEAGRAAVLAEINRTDSAQRDTRTARSASIRSLRFWQTAAVLMTAVSLSLTTSVVLRGQPEPRMVVVEGRVQVPQPTVAGGHVEPSDAQLASVENAKTLSQSVDPKGTNATVANSPTVDAWRSPSAIELPRLKVQKALEFALANGLSRASDSGRSTTIVDDPNQRVATSEPALSPLSLRGKSSGLLIHRLVEEHAL